MTAQGSPRSVFRRAIERGNLLLAEMTARELARLSLDEALALTVLAIEKAPGKRNRYAIRWLRRLLEEDENLTIDEAVLAASALAALGGRANEEALGVLSGLAARASARAPALGQRK